MDFFMGRWKTIVGETDESQQNPADTVCINIFAYCGFIGFRWLDSCPSHHFFLEIEQSHLIGTCIRIAFSECMCAVRSMDNLVKNIFEIASIC